MIFFEKRNDRWRLAEIGGDDRLLRRILIGNNDFPQDMNYMTYYARLNVAEDTYPAVSFSKQFFYADYDRLH